MNIQEKRAEQAYITIKIWELEDRIKGLKCKISREVLKDELLKLKRKESMLQTQVKNFLAIN